ncbi:hypothetical protein QP938_13275 [Porticoccaceae bacterium LTM1]|nr:hypothetical protein QP938_13275 [Porticoccaceae bacterium LTM1]
MNTTLLKDTIANAKAQETESGQLSSLLDSRISHLHHAIQLPANNSVPALLNFIVRYIEHVPEFIEAVDEIAKDAGIRTYTDPIMGIANEFFLHPPECLDKEVGLVALMNEAYLAHRLIEEINDRYMNHFGAPLVPMDMTRSNLIIHHLIGEPFANQLDSIVHSAVDQLETRDPPEQQSTFQNFCQRRRDQRDLAREIKRWPCLTDALSINLMLDGQSAQITLH